MIAENLVYQVMMTGEMSKMKERLMRISGARERERDNQSKERRGERG